MHIKSLDTLQILQAFIERKKLLMATKENLSNHRASAQEKKNQIKHKSCLLKIMRLYLPQHQALKCLSKGTLHSNKGTRHSETRQTRKDAPLSRQTNTHYKIHHFRQLQVAPVKRNKRTGILPSIKPDYFAAAHQERQVNRQTYT